MACRAIFLVQSSRRRRHSQSNLVANYRSHFTTSSGETVPVTWRSRSWRWALNGSQMHRYSDGVTESVDLLQAALGTRLSECHARNFDSTMHRRKKSERHMPKVEKPADATNIRHIALANCPANNSFAVYTVFLHVNTTKTESNVHMTMLKSFVCIEFANASAFQWPLDLPIIHSSTLSPPE